VPDPGFWWAPGESTPQFERLKALVIALVRRLAKYEPEAVELLDQINPADPGR
jgi:hypothetical protein